MQLQVVTPQGSKIEVEASDVNAPGVVGDLGILSGHRPLLTALGIGILTYKTYVTAKPKLISVLRCVILV